MTIDIKIKTALEGNEFEITAKDINDDPEEIKEVRQYLINAAIFGICDVCTKMNNNKGTSGTKPSSIRDVAKTVSRPKAQVRNDPATEKQIDRLIQLGYVFEEGENLTKTEAWNLINTLSRRAGIDHQ